MPSARSSSSDNRQSRSQLMSLRRVCFSSSAGRHVICIQLCMPCWSESLEAEAIDDAKQQQQQQQQGLICVSDLTTKRAASFELLRRKSYFILWPTDQHTHKESAKIDLASFGPTDGAAKQPASQPASRRADKQKPTNRRGADQLATERRKFN